MTEKGGNRGRGSKSDNQELHEGEYFNFPSTGGRELKGGGIN